jgi:quinol monooxygenase YgiN
MDIAKASVTEPGCFRYDVLRDPNNPETIYIFEVFRDRESHAVHTESTHFAKWFDTASHLLEGNMEIIVMNTAFPTADVYELQKVSWSFGN